MMMKDIPEMTERLSTAPGVPKRREVLILFLLLLIGSCRSSGTSVKESFGEPEQKAKIASLMEDLSPRDGNLLFFAAVTRTQHRTRELEECRMEAAAQLSRYFAVKGVTFVQTISMTTGTIVSEAGEIAFNSDRAASLAEKLILMEEIRTREGTCALFSYKPDVLPNYPFTPDRNKNPPSWTRKSLKLRGFQSAVGFTAPKRFLERTIQQADRNALAALLELNTGSISASHNDQQNKRGTRSESFMAEKASGTVREAYIISRWQDEKGNIYSLALCPLQDK